MSSAFYSKKWHTDASETAKMRKSQESPCLSWKQGRAYFHWNCLHCAVGQELQLSHTNIQANCGMFLENPISFKNPNSWCTVVIVAVTSGAGAFFSREGDSGVNTLKQGDHLLKWLGWGCNRLGGPQTFWADECIWAEILQNRIAAHTFDSRELWNLEFSKGLRGVS